MSSNLISNTRDHEAEGSKPFTQTICASNSVGRVAAFGEVIQLEENANASSNLAFSTISRLSGVRATSGAPYTYQKLCNQYRYSRYTYDS